MSDFTEIREFLARKVGQRAAVITLVEVEGSSYRRPGARMVVAADGQAAGAISGGCLETMLMAHALESIDEKPHTFAIDTTLDSDLIFGHGLGCPGKLKFVVEPFEVGSEPQALAAWEEVLHDRIRRVVVTAFDDEDMPGLTSTLRAHSDALTGESDSEVQRVAWESAGSRMVRDRGKIWFVEVIDPPVRILLIGSGLDVLPFKRLAEAAGFEVIQIANTNRAGVSCRIAAPEDIPDLAIDSRTSVVVMTHNYLQDLGYLRALLDTSPMYIGVIGSKGRFERLIIDLESEGAAHDSLARIAGPAGLDIGAETPSQIALSVLAEIQALAGGKPRIRGSEPARGRIASE